MNRDELYIKIPLSGYRISGLADRPDIRQRSNTVSDIHPDTVYYLANYTAGYRIPGQISNWIVDAV